MVTFVHLSFLHSAHSLHVYSITLFIDLHMCGQRTNPMCSKGLENVYRGPLLLPFLFFILATLGDCGSGRKEGYTMSTVTQYV